MLLRGLISLIAVFLSIAFLGQIFSIYTAFELRYKINAEVIPEGDALRVSLILKTSSIQNCFVSILYNKKSNFISKRRSKFS